jgi:hypothetical protein
MRPPPDFSVSVTVSNTPQIEKARSRKLNGGTYGCGQFVDRAMHAIRIDIDGPSYRQHVAAERAGQRPATPPSV